jgi:hypothetical protein
MTLNTPSEPSVAACEPGGCAMCQACDEQMIWRKASRASMYRTACFELRPLLPACHPLTLYLHLHFPFCFIYNYVYSCCLLYARKFETLDQSRHSSKCAWTRARFGYSSLRTCFAYKLPTIQEANVMHWETSPCDLEREIGQ